MRERETLKEIESAGGGENYWGREREPSGRENKGREGAEEKNIEGERDKDRERNNEGERNTEGKREHRGERERTPRGARDTLNNGERACGSGEDRAKT